MALTNSAKSCSVVDGSLGDAVEVALDGEEGVESLLAALLFCPEAGVFEFEAEVKADSTMFSCSTEDEFVVVVVAAADAATADATGIDAADMKRSLLTIEEMP